MRKTALVLCTCTLLASACVDYDPQSSLASAQQSYAAGDLATTSIHLRNVLQQEPDNPTARALYGRLALGAGDWPQAVGSLELARDRGATIEEYGLPLAETYLAVDRAQDAASLLESLPEQLRVRQYWLLSARASISLGSFGAAERAIAVATLADGRTADVLLVEAQLAAARGNLELAQTLAASAVESNPGDVRSRHFFGEVLAGIGQLERAEAELTRVAEEYLAGVGGPPSAAAAALLQLVQLRLALNEIDEAASAARRLSSLAPAAPLSRYAEAVVAFQRGDFDEVIRLQRQAVNQSPNQPLFLALLGAAHLARGDLAQAEQQFLEVLVTNPSDQAAIRLLAETRIRQRRPQAALDALRSFDVANDAQDFSLLTLRGAALLQAGEPEAAIPFLEQALEISRLNQAVAIQLARAYAAAGRATDASALLRELPGLDASAAYETEVDIVLSALQQGDVALAREHVDDLIAAGSEQPTSHMVAAVFFALTDELEAARDALATALSLDRAFTPAHLLLASIHAREGGLEPAEQQLLEALALDPDHYALLMGLAQLKLEQGEADEAIGYVQHAIEISDTLEPRTTLARLHLISGDIARAEEVIRQAAALSPQDPQVRLLDGAVKLERGDYSSAIPSLRDAATAYPNRPNIVLALARAQVQTGDHQGAHQTLAAAETRLPGVAELKAARGSVALATGSRDEARAAARELQSEFPQRPDGFALEGQVLYDTRDFPGATRMYEAAYGREQRWELLVSLVTSQELSGDAPSAQRSVSDWIETRPDDVRARLFLGQLYQRTEEHGLSLEQYRSVLEFDEQNVVALNNGAWEAHILGDPLAIDYAARAVELAPENASVLDTLGWILVENGQAAEALSHLRKANELTPEVHEIRYHLAVAQQQLGDASSARRNLEAILAASPAEGLRQTAEAMLREL